MKVWDTVVIGAGVGGCYLAGNLASTGQDVLCLDKSRGTGGRLSSSSLIWDNDVVSANIGCQTFAINDSRLIHLLDIAAKSGLIRHINPPTASLGHRDIKYYGWQERSSAFTRWLLGEATFKSSQKVTKLTFEDRKWLIKTDGRDAYFARQVVLALPAPQVNVLIPPEFKGDIPQDVKQQLDIKYEPRWVSTGWLKAVNHSPDYEHDSIEHFETKRHPNTDFDRHGWSTFFLQSNQQWSLSNIEMDHEQVALQHRLELSQLIDQPELDIRMGKTHLWRYCLPSSLSLASDNADKTPNYYFSTKGLGVCGDYFECTPSQLRVQTSLNSARLLLAHL